MMKEELISKTQKIDISEFFGKGCVDHFRRKHPELLAQIKKHFSEIECCSLNRQLPAKLIYISKYNADISKITHNNKIMVYSSKDADFKPTVNNSTIKQWNDCRQELSKLNDFYTREETIKFFSENKDNYYGKSGNRKLLRDDKKMFLSLYEHTKDLNALNGNKKKLSMRIYILINNVEIYCDKHLQYKHWTFKNGVFRIVCGKCNPTYPSKEWFIMTYGDNWKKFQNERIAKVKSTKTNSLDWFTKKYGENFGTTKYSEYVNTKMNKLSELKANKYSKISQELFWSIYDKLKNNENVYFAEHICEFVLRIPKKYNHKNTVMMLDFKQKNNVIEYNGNYWHNKDVDDIRYEILRDMGYNIMIVTSDEYNRNKRDELITQKCINFLEC